MKNIKDYLMESFINESSSKSISFNFSDLENAEDTIKSLENQPGVSVSDKTVTINVTADNVSELGTVQDILQQYAETIRSSQRRSSDEQYAQKSKKFQEKVAELNDAIDEIENPEDESDEDSENDEPENK